MANIALLPLLAYVCISTFTPGPANISSSSLGVLHGFRRTLRYQAGLAVGVFVMMLAGGLLSASLLTRFPVLEPALRYVGAAYILYLAYGLLRASYVFAEKATPPLGFGHGLLLNVSNPKLVVYALTLFASFLAPIAGDWAWLSVAAALLAGVSAAATGMWALFGAAIKARLRDARVTRWVNVGMALFLVYAAVELVGVVGGGR